MAKSHPGAKDFLLGAFIGGIVGIAAISLTRTGRKKSNSTKLLFDSISHFGKTMASSENNLAEIIDWTAEGIQLWNKLKKGN